MNNPPKKKGFVLDPVTGFQIEVSVTVYEGHLCFFLRWYNKQTGRKPTMADHAVFHHRPQLVVQLNLNSGKNCTWRLLTTAHMGVSLNSFTWKWPSPVLASLAGILRDRSHLRVVVHLFGAWSSCETYNFPPANFVPAVRKTYRMQVLSYLKVRNKTRIRSF